MTTIESESSVTISLDTWKTACAMTESQQEAEDLVKDVINKFDHLADDKREMAVMMQINLMASKVMTRH